MGVSIAYASVVGTGGWALVLPNHWIVLSRVREIPDTVEEFVGYRIGFDLFAWDVPGLEGVKTFYPNGKATVRNVTLPASYSHVFVPVTADLAVDAGVARVDRRLRSARGGRGGDSARRRHRRTSCGPQTSGTTSSGTGPLEAQRFVRARRALPPA